MKLRERPYVLIRAGTKTVEVRLFDEKRRDIAPGDLLIFKKEPYLHEVMYKTAARTVRFDSFAELFSAYPNEAVGCGSDDTAETFAAAMGEYYTEEKAKKYGVCAIELLPYSGGYEIHATHARRINARDIEIYFDGDFETGGEPGADEYTVSLGGTELALDPHYGHDGHVHFCRMTTLRLSAPLDCGDNAPTVKVTLGGALLEAPFEDYYRYKLVTRSGIPVRGSAALLQGMKTLERAGELIDIQLSARPDIAEQMARTGASLSVFGRGECAFHIPEHRSGYDTCMLYVEGFGGITCSITEANIWHWRRGHEGPDPEYTTRYVNENIMIHEFGHGVKIAGIDTMEGGALAEEFYMLWRHAKASGLWHDTYAISNPDEYFATLSAIWFNVMNECACDDGWDGVRGPVNTRRELYNYDIDAYRFFAKIYPFRDLDGEWSPVPDNVHVTGLSDLPDVDMSGEEHIFPYPKPTDAGEGEYALFVHGCAAGGSTRGIFARPGEVIALIAQGAEPPVRWRASAGVLEDTDTNAAEFVMPDCDAVVRADG